MVVGADTGGAMVVVGGGGCFVSGFDTTWWAVFHSQSTKPDTIKHRYFTRGGLEYDLFALFIIGHGPKESGIPKKIAAGF